ncbi:MAG: hypothetical protein ACRDPC_02040 [Solirubrobacteraceae bacterium]
MNPSHRLALLIVVVLLAAAGAAPALAGEYPVYACEPSAGDVNRSWVREWNHGGVTSYANCPLPWDEFRSWNRGLVTRHAVVPDNPNATIPTGSFAALVFHAPPGAALARVTYHHEWCGWDGYRAGIANAAGTWLRYAGPHSCGSWEPNPFTLDLGGTSAVKLMTACVAGPCGVGGGTLRAWATLRSATMIVADHTTPNVSLTGGSALASGWRRGVVGVSASAWDNVGIRSVQLLIGGRVVEASANACDYTFTTPCPNFGGVWSLDTRVVADGRHALALKAEDSARNWATTSRTILVDNTPPPAASRLTVSGGTAWRRSNNFSIRWRNPRQAGVAPIAGLQTAICHTRNPPDVWTGCIQRRFTGSNISSASGLRVPRAGQWTGRFWLRDAAGNHDRGTAHHIRLRFDDNAPDLSFKAQDADDPTRIDVLASDRTSALVRMEIEARRRGDAAWLPLVTTRSADGFFAHLDDEHLADGEYDLRARAADSAGNERSTDRDDAGAPATRTVPTRINTRFVAGQVKIVKARRSRGGKRRTRRIIVVRPRVRYGRTIPIRGRLTTPGANPVANASVEVWEQIALPGAEWRRIAMIGTNKAGRFKFKALRGPSRVLRFRYAGTPLVRARTAEVDLRVRAATTMRSSRQRVVNGDEVVFRGRVQGRPLPATGKLIQLQAYSRGRWLTFATPRAKAKSGRWSYRYRFTATRGTVRYRFRARLPREAGYPYDAGKSRRVPVVVRGL